MSQIIVSNRSADAARPAAFATLFGSLSGCLLALVLIANAVQWVAQSPQIAVAVALPAAAPVPTWVTEVDRYAIRLSRAFDLDADTARRYAPWILDAASRQRVDPDLVAGLIYAESTFRDDARSYAGAIGPAQVNPRYWHSRCGGLDLSDPEHNIQCGAIALSHYAERCGGLECALHRYNVGPSNLHRQRKAAARYVAKVGRFHQQIAAVAL